MKIDTWQGFDQRMASPPLPLIVLHTCVGVPVTTVLELFGEYFLTYCMMHGYDKMLLTLGHDFKTFIQNLDSLHALLAMSYRRIKAPSFR
jgi:guanylate cyclase soluble subunit beta